MSKAAKVLGVHFPDLIGACFTQHGQGKLKSSEFQMFWKQATDLRNGTAYIVDIFSRLLSSLETEEKTLGVPLDSLVNTIMFISLYMNVHLKDGRLDKLLNNWAQQDQAKEISRKVTSSRDVVRLLRILVDISKNKDDAQSPLSPLLITASTLHSAEAFKKLSDVVDFPTMTESDMDSADGSFVFEYLKQAVADKGILVQVLQLCRSKMVTLPQQMKMNPVVAGTTFKAFVHMFRVFMSESPIVDRPFLLNAERIIQQFFLWPRPYCDQALTVLELLRKEQATPGSVMRIKFDSESRNGVVDGKADQFGQKPRAVYYFLPKDDPASLSYTQVMGLEEFKEEKRSEASSATLSLCPASKLMLIMSALHAEAGKLSPTEVTSLSKLSSMHVYMLYGELEKALELPSRERIAALKILKQTCLASAAEGDWSVLKPDMKLPTDFSPPLPPVAHLAAYSSVGKESYKFPSVKEQEEYKGVIPPTTDLSAKMEAILSTYEKGAARHGELRIVLGGGNELMHSFLCAYVELAYKKPELFQSVQLKLFVAPLQRNHLSAYLARFDSWYNRHIYTPFRTPLYIIPWIRPEQTAQEHGDDSVCPPGVLLRNHITSYVRDSSYEFNVQLFQCDAWEHPFGEAPKKKQRFLHDHRIPFAQRFEIGLVPDVRQYQQDKNMDPEARFEDLVKDKNFVFSPPDLKVSFTSVDLDGEEVATYHEESIAYSSILVSNVPRKGDRCYPPNPQNAWLELHAQINDVRSKKINTVNRVLLTETRQHINSLEIDAGDNKFLIRLDGVNFGPYSRVRVSQMQSPFDNKDESEKALFSLPIQTFFPVKN